jgi:hypothetical protein
MNPILPDAQDPRVSEQGPTEAATAGTTPPAQASQFERRAPRIPVPQVHQPCELKTQANIFGAALINESDTGFAVLIDRLDGLDIGVEVELHTDTEWMAVEIVYIKKVIPCASSVTKCDSLFQLGVRKTHSLVPT